ncbi:hypothetical protein FGO68_gene14363 [Halteria grandinella]|uniref:Uncharacterized protein n=1 Tax=Halteria grandinella TaxID=5974 RepID=A0A8J8SZ92_HALGN|nr:hypothetical protein FGO68_gene14363 [Halteria grandinella]
MDLNEPFHFAENFSQHHYYHQEGSQFENYAMQEKPYNQELSFFNQDSNLQTQEVSQVNLNHQSSLSTNFDSGNLQPYSNESTELSWLEPPRKKAPAIQLRLSEFFKPIASKPKPYKSVFTEPKLLYGFSGSMGEEDYVRFIIPRVLYNTEKYFIDQQKDLEYKKAIELCKDEPMSIEGGSMMEAIIEIDEREEIELAREKAGRKQMCREVLNELLNL